MSKITKKFRLKDSFQQLVGGILLAGPFVVTEEVWRIAENLVTIQFFTIILFNVMMGYFALYEADKTRDVGVEQDIVGIPLRLISLILVGYLSVAFLKLLSVFKELMLLVQLLSAVSSVWLEQQLQIQFSRIQQMKIFCR